MTMSTHPRPGDRPDIPDPCPHEGAVLILLHRADDELQFPLTVRTTTVHAHKGQISLPGGAKEPEDEGFEQTALREASEELGISTGDIQILGALSLLYIPHSGFCVHPFVGYSDRTPDWRPDPDEVAELFSATVRQLLDPSTVHEEVHIRDGQSFLVPHYLFGPHKVWGATAMILAEFVALLRANPLARGC
jgi:8-oxo-dGTP pyrophosphatase MutT (NUDIX family)